MVGYGDLNGVFKNWLTSGVFWMVMAILLTLGIVVILVLHKRRKLRWNALEIISYGNGKVGINSLKCGIFKKKSSFFGLWDSGSENVIKCADGRIILEASTGDLQDIMGKKGFMLRRKDDDPKILVPISKVKWENEAPLFAIAPADFRDASVNIVDTATKETISWADKYLPYIMLGGMVVFFIVGFILASQFFNRAMDKSLEIQKLQCGNFANVQPGGAP